MNRVTVFSHFDKNNLIQDYVVYYLKELKQVSENIIFVSDCKISNEELEKIRPYVKEIIAKRHGEYDFGSYKRGYLYAKENNLLPDCEELIFANDSCYAPLYHFDEMFDKMSKQKLDFWGVTKNSFEYLPPHIQSYFFVLKPIVFNSEIFDNFVTNITKQERKHLVVMKYEVLLSKKLEDAGFKWDVYSELSKTSELAILRDYKNLIKVSRSPFLKRNIVLLKEQKEAYPFMLKSFLNKHTKYDYRLIANDIKHNRIKFSIFKFLAYLRRKMIKLHLKAGRVCLFGKWIYFKQSNINQRTI